MMPTKKAEPPPTRCVNRDSGTATGACAVISAAAFVEHEFIKTDLRISVKFFFRKKIPQKSVRRG